MDDKHILVSLGDDKVKQIGEVIGNKTCNKILDLLSTQDLTVTDISQKLKIPLNTTDYNIKKLVKSGLIEKSNHFWSIKGKKMPTYKVSNRKIIISPRRSIHKAFVWVTGLTGLMAITVRQITKESVYLSEPVLATANDLMYKAAPKAMELAEIQSMSMNAGASEAAFEAVAEFGFWSNITPWAWFLIGAWVSIFLFFAFSIYSERRNK